MNGATTVIVSRKAAFVYAAVKFRLPPVEGLQSESVTGARLPSAAFVNSLRGLYAGRQ